MPSYVYTGDAPRILFGLSEGVNAWHGSGALPAGSTVVVEPGDTITTAEPYEHAWLEETTAAAGDAVPAPKRRKPPTTDTPEPAETQE